MSTRATVHFKDTPKAKPTAIVYRHGDGYPTGLGADLKAFFKELADHVGDTRFTDSSYLAAKCKGCGKPEKRGELGGIRFSNFLLGYCADCVNQAVHSERHPVNIRKNLGRKG